MTGTFSYHDASFKGDPRWSAASRWTGKAPLLVLNIWGFAILETILGAVWISQLSSNMTIPKILQPLILPGLAFFNGAASLHCHCFLRNNPPILALWISGIFTVLWFSSFITYLVSCGLPASSTSLGLRQAECSTSSAGVQHGPGAGLWWVVIVLELGLLIGYAIHTTMAFVVWRASRNAPRAVTTDEERAKARELLRRLG